MRLEDTAEILKNFAEMFKQQNPVESVQDQQRNYINQMLQQDGSVGFADAMLATILASPSEVFKPEVVNPNQWNQQYNSNNVPDAPDMIL